MQALHHSWRTYCSSTSNDLCLQIRTVGCCLFCSIVSFFSLLISLMCLLSHLSELHQSSSASEHRSSFSKPVFFKLWYSSVLWEMVGCVMGNSSISTNWSKKHKLYDHPNRTRFLTELVEIWYIIINFYYFIASCSRHFDKNDCMMLIHTPWFLFLIYFQLVVCLVIVIKKKVHLDWKMVENYWSRAL